MSAALHVNVSEARARLSALMRQAHEGREVVILKAGRPYARLVPIMAAADRRAGAFRGQITGDVLSRIPRDRRAKKASTASVEVLLDSARLSLDLDRSRPRPRRRT
jgi:prevent-host-death family protein